MRTAVLLLLSFAALSFASQSTNALLELLKNRKISSEAESLTGQALVDYVNNNQHFWTAKLGKRFAGMPFEEKRKMIAGVKGGAAMQALIATDFVDHSALDVDIPDFFDARQQWPECSSISYIRDQSACGSCWSFGTSEAMSDRTCIASGGKTQVILSAADILSCCGIKCGSGCDGGFPLQAWKWWVSNGVVSGTNYADKGGCKPYPFAECEHHNNNTGYAPCPADLYNTPKCEKSCQAGFSTSYASDKHYGKSAYSVKSKVSEIQKEILQNGPVEASYDVYEDFEHYYSGVYVHTSGRYLGGHAVRLLGWGTDEQSGLPYWLVANSWNADWGEQGYFRIIRGQNECGFEAGITAGLAKI